jgi:S1/P1 Nuclease
MNSSRFYFVLACLLPAALVMAPRESLAWDAEGHMIIALIADRLLQAHDPAVQKKVAEILATDKSNTWTKTDIADEATWADALRKQSPEGRVWTSKWPYVKFDPADPDLAKACFGKPALPASTPASHGPREDCVVNKIDQFVKELRDPATSAGERLMALQFLLNYIGEVHDPLDTVEHNDQAGSCVAVLAPGAKAPVRLNLYWDDILVAEAEGKDAPKAAERTVAGLAAADIEKWSKGTPAEWARESYDLAKRLVYSYATDAAGKKYTFPAKKGERDPCGPVPLVRLDTGYRDRAVTAVREQLAKAGVRLAFVLRETLR